MAICLPKRLIQSSMHKGLRYLVQTFSWGDLVELLFGIVAAAGTVVLTLATVRPETQEAGWVLFFVLLALGVLRLFLLQQDARRSGAMRKRVMYSLLTLLHEKVFFNSPDFRLTLFICDPVAAVRARGRGNGGSKQRILVPTLRRTSGNMDPECADSRIYYPQNSTATTAKAWRRAVSARDDLRAGDFGGWLEEFPPFESRKLMEDHYERDLHVDPEVISRLSDYMVDVVQILSFPFVDHQGNPICLLSVDVQRNLLNDDTDAGQRLAPDIARIDRDLLAGYLAGARRILMSLSPVT